MLAHKIGINKKRKGARREYQARDFLLSSGAIDILKAGGSLGAFDLIAIMEKQVLLVQVKSNKWTSLAEDFEIFRLIEKMDDKIYKAICMRKDDGESSELWHYMRYYKPSKDGQCIIQGYATLVDATCGEKDEGK